MDVLVLVLRLALGAVFVLSGVSKLADSSGTRDAVREFGAPAALVRPIAFLLPIGELTVVGLVLFPATAVAGALLALALLAAFSVAIAVNLRKGRRPNCHCFGQIGSEPIGARTLGRNAGIASIAVLVAGFGWKDSGPSGVAWIGDLGGAEVAALCLGVLVLAALALGARFALALLRQHGRLLIRVEQLEAALANAGMQLPGAGGEREAASVVGLDVGTQAPPFALRALDDASVELSTLLEPELPLLLVFSDPGCGPCDALAPDIARWQREHADEVTVAVLSAGESDGVAERAAEHGLERVLVDAERSVADSFEAYGIPAAVLIAPSGSVASFVAQGAEDIARLFERARTCEEPRPPGLPVGDPAPELTLTELGGGEIVLRERLAGDRDTAIVFWNPGCGFCRSMYEQLRALEEQPSNGGPALLVMSTGDQEAIRDEGFKAPVLLDPDFSGAGAFNANGTPMAVLVNPDGSISSPIAIGASDVLALVSGRAADSAAGLEVVQRA